MKSCILSVVTASLLAHSTAHVEECVEDNSELQTHQPLEGSAVSDWRGSGVSDSEFANENRKFQAPPAACALPANGAWASVMTPGQAPFYMAVYATKDIVSTSLQVNHNWEDLDSAFYGKPGHAYDIGANIGVYTFVLAKAGWNVTSFEPMPANQALFNATLCANPDIVGRVDLKSIGLGNAASHCRVISDVNNVGDGNTQCGKKASTPVHPGYVVRAEFDVERLDDVMSTSKFASQHVDFVKIDVEGFECKVFEGGKELLAARPRLIQSEVWQNMQDCTDTQYLQLFTEAKYELKADVHCDVDASAAGPSVPIGNYWMCRAAPTQSLVADPEAPKEENVLSLTAPKAVLKAEEAMLKNMAYNMRVRSPVKKGDGASLVESRHTVMLSSAL